MYCGVNLYSAVGSTNCYKSAMTQSVWTLSQTKDCR